MLSLIVVLYSAATPVDMKCKMDPATVAGSSEVTLHCTKMDGTTTAAGTGSAAYPGKLPAAAVASPITPPATVGPVNPPSPYTNPDDLPQAAKTSPGYISAPPSISPPAPAAVDATKPIAPKPESKAEPKAESKPEPKAEPKPEPKPEPSPANVNPYSSLVNPDDIVALPTQTSSYTPEAVPTPPTDSTVSPDTAASSVPGADAVYGSAASVRMHGIILLLMFFI